METLSISKENALTAYEKATPKRKKLLSDLFGKKVFQKNILERIKTYEDACEDQGITPLDLSDFLFLPEIDQKHSFAAHKVNTIIRSLNEGWTPDFNNSSEPKYYVWYKWAGSGSGFSSYGCGYDHVLSDVGARLHFKTRELAQYFATQFIKEVNEYFIIEN